MRPLSLGREIATIDAEGGTLRELADNLAEAVVRAAGDRNVALVGPFIEIAERGSSQLGLYLALAHQAAAPLLYFARCKPTASEASGSGRRGKPAARWASSVRL